MYVKYEAGTTWGTVMVILLRQVLLGGTEMDLLLKTGTTGGNYNKCLKWNLLVVQLMAREIVS